MTGLGLVALWSDQDGRGDERPRGVRRPGERGRRPDSADESLKSESPLDGDRPFGEIREFLEEHFPDRLAEMERFRETNPEGFRQQMGRMFPRVRRMMEMQRRNPEAAHVMLREQRLEFQIQSLVEQYFAATSDERISELRAEIREMVEKQFDTRLEMRELEIQRLERRLQAIRTQTELDREHREQRIEQQMGELGVFEQE